MIILVFNTGSSSIKYRLLDMNVEETIVQGMVEHIGGKSIITQKTGNGDVQSYNVALPDHRTAFYYLFSLLDEKREIDAIGHRIAHGGICYTQPTIITDRVISVIEELAEFAPLHNRANALGIRICSEVFGSAIPQVAVFDTAFHKDLPPYAFLYPLPYRYYTDYGIRRFGFHGISHRYASERCTQLMGRNELRIITCHLGNGCSVAAIKNGVCLDTSMGLTPNEGVMMGTRSGSIDPTILSYIAKHERIPYEDVLEVSIRESGLLGISGVSNDYRDLAKSNSERTQLAIHMQEYQILKIIGSYIAVLDGVDAIVFTGGIGEHVPELRLYICEHLNYAGVVLDDAANCSSNAEKRISAVSSKVEIFVIPANEELVIAKDTVYALDAHNNR